MNGDATARIQSEVGPKLIVVSRIKKRYTANEILKQAGLDKVFRFSHSRAAPTDR